MSERRVAVAYSGGRDSTALLHATLLEAATYGVHVLARYGVDTLEEAFFAATGRTFEDEKTEEDEEREVFA